MNSNFSTNNPGTMITEYTLQCAIIALEALDFLHTYAQRSQKET